MSFIIGTGGVNSVFGRIGNVIAKAGDYDASQVDYNNSVSGLSALNVQAAIDELDAAFGTLPGGHAAFTLQSGNPTQESTNLVGQELELLQATASTDGLMSSEDKTKLDSYASPVAEGDILIADATPDFINLTIGSAGEILTVGGSGRPEWAAGALRPVTTETGLTYLILSGDYRILLDATSNNVTASLPSSPSAGQEYVVKRIDNTGNSVILDTTDAALIDGSASITLFEWDSYTVFSDGTDWFIQ